MLIYIYVIFTQQSNYYMYIYSLCASGKETHALSSGQDYFNDPLFEVGLRMGKMSKVNSLLSLDNDRWGHQKRNL